MQKPTIENQEPTQEKEFLNLKEVSAEVGVPVGRLYDDIRANKLRAYQLPSWTGKRGKGYLCKPADVQEYKTNCLTPQPANFHG